MSFVGYIIIKDHTHFHCIIFQPFLTFFFYIKYISRFTAHKINISETHIN